MHIYIYYPATYTDVVLLDFLFIPELNRYRCLRCTGDDTLRDLYPSAALTHELTEKHRCNAKQYAASLRAADAADWPMFMAASTSVRPPGPDYPGQAFSGITSNPIIAGMFSRDNDDTYESSTRGAASGHQSSHSPFVSDAFSAPSPPPHVNPQLLTNHLRSATDEIICKLLADLEIASDQSRSSSSSEAGDVAGGESPAGPAVHVTD